MAATAAIAARARCMSTAARCSAAASRFATLEGARVTTIEGLSANGAHPVQQAWLAEQVTMCGYCEPGFIMAIAALLDASPNPSDEQVAALPNLCRCGAYARIRKAIRRAAQARAAQSTAAPAN